MVNKRDDLWVVTCLLMVAACSSARDDSSTGTTTGGRASEASPSESVDGLGSAPEGTGSTPTEASSAPELPLPPMNARDAKPVEWDAVRVILEEELSTGEREATMSPTGSTERVCEWDLSDGDTPELTPDERLEVGRAALAALRDELPPEREVNLYWLTRLQATTQLCPSPPLYDPSDGFADTLSISIAPRGAVIVDRCGIAYTPLILGVRSTETAVDGVGLGYLTYPSDSVDPYVNSATPIALYDEAGVHSHDVRIAWDAFVENWRGTVTPVHSSSLVADTCSELVVEDPETLWTANFPAMCGGVAQVPVEEPGGFVAAADIQRLTKELGVSSVEFAELGTTRLAFELTELLSDTTCLNLGDNEFRARVGLLHESGARHEYESLVSFNACTPPLYARASSCVHLEYSVTVSFVVDDAFSMALAEDLGFELSDDPRYAYSMSCTLALDVTAQSAEPTDGSFCELWTDTDTVGRWRFDQ